MKHFIYTDTDILNSYLSQINDGLISRYGDHYTESLTDVDLKGLSPGGKSSEAWMGLSSILGIKSSENADIEASATVLSKSKYGKELMEKILHDNAFERFMKYLSENDNIRTLADSNLGDYVRFESEYNIADLDYFVNLYTEEFINFLADNELKEIKDSLSPNVYKLKRNELIQTHKNTKKIFTIVQNMLPNAKFLYSKDWLILLEPKHLRESIASIRFKYTGKITVIGKYTNDLDRLSTSAIGDSNFQNMLSSIDSASFVFFKDVMKLNSNMKILIPIALYFQ